MTTRRVIALAMTMAVAVGCQTGTQLGQHRPDRGHGATATTVNAVGTVTCDTYGDAFIECVDEDGTVIASGIEYADEQWYLDGVPMSDLGVCPEEDSCHVTWDEDSAAPIATPTINY